MLKQLIEMFPTMSLLQSQKYLYLIIFPIILGTLQMCIALHLAWYSIGIKVPVKKSLVPALILSILTFLLRQLIPVILHLIPVLVIFAIIVWKVGRTTLRRAVIGTLFAELMVVSGSMLIVAPIFSGKWPFDNPLGFSLGTLLETVFPALVLFLFIKFRIRIKGFERKHRGQDEAR